jgi:siroheme synthase
VRFVPVVVLARVVVVVVVVRLNGGDPSLFARELF